MNTRQFSLPALALAAGLGLSGCAGMSDTQQRTLTGAAIGTAGGAAIGAMAGNAGLGALIGAGVGAGTGYLVDRSRQREQAAFNRGVQQGRQ